jgi:hypothetical protein
MSVTSTRSGASGLSLALDNNYMEPIASILVGSSVVGTVTFNDIPQTYKHLQIRGMGRTNRNSARDQMGVRFNSDNGSNYSTHELNGDGATVTALGTVNYNSMEYGFALGAATATSGIVGGGIIDILDYANTNKNKTIRSLGGADTNGAGKVMLGSGAWYNTTPVTSITILSSTGSSFVQHSRFSLYGIKG